MYIKSYSCTRFAGLSNKNIEFQKGLNVILGPNESGKSTIINGIHSTLFKDIRLRRNLSADKDFIHRYMPKPDGDFIDGKLVISLEGRKYELGKEWGVNEEIHFVTPDGNIMKNEESIKEELSKLLLYGEGTYSNIVFAKQKDLKVSLSNIMENSELTNEINSLLRKSMMELDGVSIDHLQKRIEDELEKVYKRWDIDRSCPMNNRGVSNPYKNGLGEILESYYEKENLALLMEEAEESEKRFESICDEISKLESRIDKLRVKKEKLEKIEEDINSRLVLNGELKFINRELEDLIDANREWPKASLLLEQYKDSLLEIEEKRKGLDIEKASSTKVEKKKSLERKLENLEEIDSKMDEVVKDIEETPKITKEDIEKITKVQKKILTLDTSMAAGVMMGELKSSTDRIIWITRDFGQREKLEVNKEFQAKGLINITLEDKMELEIRTGEFDFKELKKEYDQLVLEEKEILEDLGIKTLEEGKLNLEKLSQLDNERKSLEGEKNIILDSWTMEGLLKEIEGLQGIENLREISEIDRELELISVEERDLLVNKRTKENQVEKWEEKYQDEDNLLDILIDRRSMEREKRKELEKLAPLPEEFNSPEEFKKTLEQIKLDFEEGQGNLVDLREEYHDAKNQLLDISYEEIHRSYVEADERFNRDIEKGKNLQEVQKVFIQTKEDLDKNPMESLVKEFSRVLSLITSETYKTGHINEDFNIKLKNPKGEIPMDLLSAGTYDSVVLALRFALLKHIFQDRKGYVVLDDCLVDLDPMRKEESVKLIKDFARENQVIFTTCDPETAKLLGGSTIEL